MKIKRKDLVDSENTCPYCNSENCHPETCNCNCHCHN